MAKVEVVMPQLGESLTEGTIIKWHKKPGEKIKKEETLLEISTDKVDSEIPAPVSGVVTKLLFDEQKTVAVRTVIAEIETDEAAAVVAKVAGPPTSTEPTPPPAPIKEAKPVAPPTPVPTAVPATGRFYSPLVLNIAREEGIPMGELERIPGTGEGGRVTKKDILAYVQARGAAAKGAPSPGTTQAAVPTPTFAAPMAPRIEATLKHVETGDLAKKYPPPQYEILQMSNVLQKMAEHMVRSVQTSPHVQAISSSDMTNIVDYRARHAEEFEKREGFKLTYTPFIADAVVKALKEFPLVNSSVEGDKIIIKKFVNLGIAVASENGLIVPVIKNADEKNFLGIARAINDLAARTRTKRLLPTDIEGGTFTITNYGVFGNIIGIPIINQPQVAILGIGAIKKQPVVISAEGGSQPDRRLAGASGGNDAIAIRSIAYLTLSFDHRIIDGALGGSFLERVVKLLESFDVKSAL